MAGTGSHKPYLFNAGNVEKFAPGPWHSRGSVVDASYEALEAVARSGKRLERPGRVEHAAVQEPPLLNRPPFDVPAAKVQRIDEVINDPQIQARGMLLEQQHPRYGTLKLPNLPFRFSDCDTTAPMQQVAPDLGQHNADIARKLGYSDQDIQILQAEGVLFSV